MRPAAWRFLSVPRYGSPAITLTVTNNATLQPGGGIIADGTGNPSGSGPQ